MFLFILFQHIPWIYSFLPWNSHRMYNFLHLLFRMTQQRRCYCSRYTGTFHIRIQCSSDSMDTFLVMEFCCCCVINCTVWYSWSIHSSPVILKTYSPNQPFLNSNSFTFLNTLAISSVNGITLILSFFVEEI